MARHNNKCQTCQKVNVTGHQKNSHENKCIQCDLCFSWFHTKCHKISVEELATFDNLESDHPWFCNKNNCREKIKELKGKNREYISKIKNLEKELAKCIKEKENMNQWSEASVQNLELEIKNQKDQTEKANEELREAKQQAEEEMDKRSYLEETLVVTSENLKKSSSRAFLINEGKCKAEKEAKMLKAELFNLQVAINAEKFHNRNQNSCDQIGRTNSVLSNNGSTSKQVLNRTDDNPNQTSPQTSDSTPNASVSVHTRQPFASPCF